jgi:hypothetical protein
VPQRSQEPRPTDIPKEPKEVPKSETKPVIDPELDEIMGKNVPKVKGHKNH